MVLFKTPPLEIVDAPADIRHRGSKRREQPQFIVLHHTGPWPALRWLTTDARSDVSAHRYIEPDKPVYKLVEDDYVASTQGFADVGPWSDLLGRNFNQVCLSIEGCFNPDKDVIWHPSVVMRMCWQVCEWWGLYGFLPIVYHWQIDARKDDPMRFPRQTFDSYLMRLVAAAYKGTLDDWRHFIPSGVQEG